MVALAAFVRLLGLFKHATIPDEAFTFFIAAHPLPQIVELLKTGDFHPPLLYLIGHSLFTFSSHAYLFRLVSAAFGVAGVAATFIVARRLAPQFALVAAFLVAVCPPLVFYDGFFRMYAMLWSLCIVSWALLLWALDSPRQPLRWVLYGISLCALIYTHYLGFFTVAAQVGYVAIFQRRATGFWIALAATAAAFVPWLHIFVEQYPLGGTAYRALQGHLSQLALIPSVLLIDGLPASLELNWFVVTVLWLAVIGGTAVAIARKQWLALALLAPLLLQVGYSFASGKLLFGQRYMLQAIPALIILICMLLGWLWSVRIRPLAVALTALLGVLMTAGTLDKHFLPQYMPVDWTSYRQFLDARIQSGDAVVYDGSMVYYVLVGSKATQSPQQFLITNSADAAKYGTQAARLPRVWYIGYQSELPDPDRMVFRTLLRTHPRHVSWRSTTAAYGDLVLTTLFLLPAPKRGP